MNAKSLSRLLRWLGELTLPLAVSESGCPFTDFDSARDEVRAVPAVGQDDTVASSTEGQSQVCSYDRR